jgi:hypothetical protein
MSVVEVPLNLQFMWQEAFDLGYQNPDQRRWDLWKSISKKWDGTEILGTWKQPSERDVNHMLYAINQMSMLDPLGFDFVCWHVGCNVNRIRIPASRGGSDLPVTARALAEIAFDLGGIGGIRISPTSHIAPPITNYIVFNS